MPDPSRGSLSLFGTEPLSVVAMFLLKVGNLHEMVIQNGD